MNRFKEVPKIGNVARMNQTGIPICGRVVWTDKSKFPIKRVWIGKDRSVFLHTGGYTGWENVPCQKMGTRTERFKLHSQLWEWNLIGLKCIP